MAKYYTTTPDGKQVYFNGNKFTQSVTEHGQSFFRQVCGSNKNKLESNKTVCRRHRFWHATLKLCSAICWHHPPQRAVLSQICYFRERTVVVSQILLDGVEPHDAGMSWLSSPVSRRAGTRHLHCHPCTQCAQTEEVSTTGLLQRV